MIDCNTFLGNWAFRRLRHNDAPGLVAMLDQFGIDKAVVASADAILYKDAQAGNEKLYEETREHDSRLLLYATLNPAYAGWERDLRTCKELGFKALRLYPTYHGYSLSGREANAVLGAAAEAGLPVSIPCRVIDKRQRHWFDFSEDIAPGDILAAAKRNPKATVIITEGIVAGVDWESMRQTSIYIEMSRMSATLDRPLQTAVDMLGPERILLGTGFPFKAMSPAFLKIQVLDAPDEAKALITDGNARRLFGE